MLATTVAYAKPQTLTWAWPTTNCDDTPLTISDLTAAELIYDTSPMPMPSDTAGPCSSTNDPPAPASATTVPITMPDASVTLNLQPGETYYARIRVEANTAGNWSVWSVEYQFTVPYGRPNRAIFLQ